MTNVGMSRPSRDHWRKWWEEHGAEYPPMMLVEDVSAMLGAAPSTIAEWARRGRIPHFKAPGTRRLLFRIEELEAWSRGSELEIVRLPGNGRRVRVKGLK